MNGDVSPAIAAANHRKEATLRIWVAEQERQHGGGGVTPYTHLTFRSGYLLGYLYQEAQSTYAAEWCGPGATSSVTAFWSVQRQGQANKVTNYTGWGGGSIGFMKHLVYDDHEVSNNTGPGDTQPFDEYTSWTNFINVTNTEASTSGWYVQTPLAGYTDFQHKLSYDVAYTGVPLPVIVRTTGMTGWTQNADHFVTVYGFNFDSIPNGYIQWGDSAGALQSGGASFGWHDDKTLSAFYNTFMVNANLGFAW